MVEMDTKPQTAAKHLVGNIFIVIKNISYRNLFVYERLSESHLLPLNFVWMWNKPQ